MSDPSSPIKAEGYGAASEVSESLGCKTPEDSTSRQGLVNEENASPIKDNHSDRENTESESESDAEEDDLPFCDMFKEEIVKMKWRVLVVACFLTFGSYYIFDFPGAIGTGTSNTIQSRFVAHGKTFTQEMNQSLYSVYSYPNTVLAIFGGLLIDKFLGLRKSMLLFMLLITAGSGLFYLGVVLVNYPLMLAARLLFGLGGESLAVAQSALVARWFRGGRGMALAFGITISFSRVGSSFNFLFSTRFAGAYGINVAVLMGVIACVLSLLACFVLIAMDYRASKTGVIKDENIGGDEDQLELKHIKNLPIELWLLTIICVFCYTAIFPFVGIGKNFFEVKFGMTADEASTWISLYQFSSAGASPVIGAVVDKCGRLALWLVLASATFVSIHVLMLATPIPPYISMTMMGLFYSFLVSGLWPSVPFAVDERVVGISYGIITAMQNAGLATFPLISGAILDDYTPASLPTPMVNQTTAPNSTNYTLVPGVKPDDPLPTKEGFNLALLVFMGSAGISLATSIVLVLVDRCHGGVLTSSPAKRTQLIKERTARNEEAEAEKEALLG